jgi:chromate reductase, NAD(P)H dehydrogenase (quinone)
MVVGACDAGHLGVGRVRRVHERRIEIAAVVGSLRRQSFNRGLLRTAMLLQPEDLRLVEVSINTLPYFNEDVEASGDPPLVNDFKSALRRADGVLICTPEYGYSIPGVLKNALDWASRPTGRSVLRGKPIGLLGASIGRSGTMRAQLHLRQIFLQMGAIVIPEPEVFVTFAPDKFNQLGELTDQTSRELTRQLLANLADWAVLLRGQR